MSLVPAVTEMLFAIGAGPQVVGVSSFDTFPPEVEKLPRVGALLDPDIERILSLRPDLVVVYGSQTDSQAQFDARRHPHVQLSPRRHRPTILDTMTRRSARATGHDAQARRVVARICRRGSTPSARGCRARRGRARCWCSSASRRRCARSTPAAASASCTRCSRSPAAHNVFADVARESVQPSQETLLARAPEVILELRADGLLRADDAGDERDVWSTLASLPAVRDGRVHFAGRRATSSCRARASREGAEAFGARASPRRRSNEDPAVVELGQGQRVGAARAATSSTPAPSPALLTTSTRRWTASRCTRVRREVLEAQARAAGLPLRIVPIPHPCSNEIYEQRMGAAVAAAVADGFTHVAFGDLFLEDVRRYREERLAGTGLSRCFRCGASRRARSPTR